MLPSHATSRSTHSVPTQKVRIPASHLLTLLGLWLVIYFTALFSPPLLDDADATHAQAARAILTTGDWVTLHVDGVRYLEKPPLPYWLVAISFRLFGFNSFATHLPGAVAVLALAMIGYLWAARAFSLRTAFYTACATLTCTGVFLFTRVFIPEALLSLFLAAALFAFLRSLDSDDEHFPPWKAWPYLLWIALACAVLTKGFVALIFFIASAATFLAITQQGHKWRRLKHPQGLALFLLIAAPWHILASIRNTGGVEGHGFAWFYFVNEHVLRFLGRRTPRDYNKLPAALYWSLHVIWLFPWSFFTPLTTLIGWRSRRNLRACADTAAGQTVLLLTIFAVIVTCFFALSTNQEYYTFPAYLPLLMLTAAAVFHTESNFEADRTTRRWLLTAHAVYAATGLAVAAVLAYALWLAQPYARPADIGALLAHRNVSNYTLSMASLFDLTGPSFAALRLPAFIALITFAVGPAIALVLRLRRAHQAATITVALSSAVFLLAAHIAFVRFAPMLSSKDFADRISALAVTGKIEPGAEVLLYGDQAYGSSIAFYLHQPVMLVDGRTTSMYFGSTFPDAPDIFLTLQQLAEQWGRGPRKILFVPIEHRQDADRLLVTNRFLLMETSGKLLLTDRPLSSLTPRASSLNKPVPPPQSPALTHPASYPTMNPTRKPLEAR